jgi:hypothetical protein
MIHNLSSHVVYILVVVVVLYCSTPTHAAGADPRPPSQYDPTPYFVEFFDKFNQFLVREDSSQTTQILLLNDKSTTVRREWFDRDFWFGNGSVTRMPEALTAMMADVVPEYVGTTEYHMSTRRVSSLWNEMLTSYILPNTSSSYLDPKVAGAKAALAAGQLEANMNAARDRFEQQQQQVENARVTCLMLQMLPPAACARQSVLYRRQLQLLWMDYQSAKTLYDGARATVVAVDNLKSTKVMDDAKKRFSAAIASDMGAQAFDSLFYRTDLQPSNWWTLIDPDDTAYNLVVVYGTTTTVRSVLATDTVVFTVPPKYGTASVGMAGTAIVYTPTSNALLTDYFSYTINAAAAVRVVLSIRPTTEPATPLSAAFWSTFTFSGQSTSFESHAKTQTLSTTLSISTFFGSRSWSDTSTKSSYDQSSTFQTMTIQASIGRVNINRSWFDTAILGIYPMALPNTPKFAWSDGLITPSIINTHKLKVFASSLILARDLVISNTNWGTMRDDIVRCQIAANNCNVKIGPWSIGLAYEQYGSEIRPRMVTAVFDGDTLKVPQVQIVGWMCTVVPPFPSATPAEVLQYQKNNSN